jgi:hypothetical protein
VGERIGDAGFSSVDPVAAPADCGKGEAWEEPCGGRVTTVSTRIEHAAREMHHGLRSKDESH